MEDYWKYIINKIQERGLQARRNAQKLIRDMENGYQIIE